MTTECQEVASNLPWPNRQISYSEAMKLVRGWMPDESETVISNIAWAGAQCSLARPPTFVEVSADRYDEMLNVLPPLAWVAKGFLVGEAYSQTPEGEATYTAMVQLDGRFYESQGSITVRAWRALEPRTFIKV